MEFLFEYGLFLAKAVTFVVAIAAIIIVAAASSKNVKSGKGSLHIHDLSDTLEHYEDQLQHQLLSDDQLKARSKAAKAEAKTKAKQEKDKERDGRLFVIDFKAGIDAAEVSNLREEISALLTVAEAKDELLVRVESGGGMVHAYGLAASQLDRVRQAEIPMTIAVDKVAASGGYMMACVANKVIAAPFAIVGSIGVIAQLPNFNKVLKKNDIDFEMHTAGEFKRTITMFGENSDEARAKFKEELEQTHGLFKQFVSKYRPEMEISKVATGEHWFGQQALELGLIDAIQTSDDYLMQSDKQILQLQYKVKQNIAQRFGKGAESVIERGMIKLAELGQLGSR
ncbi:protease SohB [Ferrimonas lipolytica]|uniref:Protease SohB n=1 Tax=Ferrimonas lipolytica TaxID=2724191 RepID=A0A6H1ULX0_9GAMM|nr:protease SohB [Ferrimonas lipolytica]QIZ78792.1 protease SohB [Ferrimonas lipolytica]